MSRRSTASSRCPMSNAEISDGGGATIPKTGTSPRTWPPVPSHDPPALASDGRMKEVRDGGKDATPSCREGCEPPGRGSRVTVISRHELRNCVHWQRAFASQHKDRRYYEIVEDTIHPEFDYWYFAIRNHQGEIQAIQPFFILDQDILAGIHPNFGRLTDAIRRRWPRFMFMKTMMVGCVAGEAHLDGDDS